MIILEKFLKLASDNIYVFILSIVFVVILLYSIFVIFDFKNINPFLYFEF
jgi:hypothetical protein